MITPEKLVRLFENPAVSTYGARCPVCRQNSLRIYSSSEGTGCRCINGCRRTDILAQVGLPPGALRPDLSCLTTALVPSANTKVATTQAARTELILVEKDATPGGQQ
jgi:hypothetical protein